jgi:non-specific serine/threonine protein kinase
MDIALSAIQQGHFARARTYLEESLPLCRAPADTRLLAGALHLLGEVALNEGAYPRAIAMAERSIAFSRAREDTRFLIHSLNNLARAFLCQGELRRALPLWAEGLRLSREWRHERATAYYLEGFAIAAAHQGRVQRAACLAGAAHTLRQEIGSPQSAPEVALVERFLAPARAHLGAATWQARWQDGCALSLEAAVAYALQERAEDEKAPLRCEVQDR